MGFKVRKYSKFRFVFIIGIALAFSSFGQSVFLGKISDPTTGLPLEQVRITHSNKSETIFSDKNGAFKWVFGVDPISDNYFIANNVFYAPANENPALQLFDNKGTKIFETGKLGRNATFLLPKLANGIYLLKVINESEIVSFKLSSFGLRLNLLQNRKDEKNTLKSGEPDTLFFTKEGYFSHFILVPRKDTVFNVFLFPEKINQDFLTVIPNYQIYKTLQGSPFVTNQGEVETVKFIYNERDNQVYFMNTKRYDIHYYFAEKFLGYTKGHQHFNATQYSNSSQRYLFSGSINYYKALDKYVLRFYPGDEMDCSQINTIYSRILSLSYLNKKLYFFPNNPGWDNCFSIPIITSEELYGGQNYQALNLGSTYGYLRKIDIKNNPELYLGKRDIVLLNDIPNDISVVAGIITTEFQTPLSHINILSHNRGTPNMALRNGWTHEKLDTLLGELVYLDVQADSFLIRKAQLNEATAFWNEKEPQTEIMLEKDVQTKGLVNLQQAGINDVKKIGGKAANFAELLKIQHPNIPTPENSFAIPFYYYQQHLQNNAIQTFINQLLNESEFKQNQEYREEKLKELQQKIIDAPLNQELLQLVENKINNFGEFESFRFRSSTNAEDLEFFSGAGLYDSFSAQKNSETKTIENALKKVWASLWNFRAFEEREYYKINHLSAAMGILVHRSFPNEDANGVVITKNLYNINPGFVVNAQFKEFSIVYPEPGILHDQIILYAYSLQANQNFTIEYLSHSNIPELKGKTVLSEKELMELGDYCMQIKRYFFYSVPHQCNCLFNDF